MNQEVRVVEASERKNAEGLAGREELASTVETRHSFSQEVVMLSEPRGSRAEAVRTLRTHLMAKHLDEGRRGLAVCAASAGVGATFTAVNLAVALAQVGAKVMLIDGDLRQGAIDQFIVPPPGTRGLLHCLSDEAMHFSQSVQSDVIENLSVMFAGGRASNAQELLAGDRFGQTVAQCLRDYDITIVDTPAANACADARRIATVVGYGLIVARRHQSFVSDVKALAAQLRDDRAQVIGTVLNET